MAQARMRGSLNIMKNYFGKDYTMVRDA